MSDSIYTGLNYTTTIVNMDWRIKVTGTRNGQKVHTLVGISGLIDLVGIELTNTFISRSYKSGADKCVNKLRTGLTVILYSK